MSDLQKLIEEGRKLLDETKPVVKSVEVTHDAPDPENPGTHSTHVRYALGGNEHHYELSTQEHPKGGGIHHVHKTSPDGEPVKDAEGKEEPPIHHQKVQKQDLKSLGGHKVHQLLVKRFTDRLHPTEPKRAESLRIPRTEKEIEDNWKSSLQRMKDSAALANSKP
jgi:hypothetical protein